MTKRYSFLFLILTLAPALLLPATAGAGPWPRPALDLENGLDGVAASRACSAPQAAAAPAEEDGSIRSGWCGDGTCSLNNPYEDCLSCPEDCTCGPECPFPLPPITRERQISATVLNYQCYDDVLNPGQSVLYAYTEYYMRLRAFTRVQNCDGSITETLVSTTFFYDYCFVRTSTPCAPSLGPMMSCYSL